MNVTKRLLDAQDSALLALNFYGKPIHAMDREELKGLVCWMLKHPEDIAVLRNLRETTITSPASPSGTTSGSPTRRGNALEGS